MSNKKIIDDINIITSKKDKSASPIGNNINYITGNIKSVDKNKIIYLSNNIDRIESIGKFAVSLKILKQL